MSRTSALLAYGRCLLKQSRGAEAEAPLREVIDTGGAVESAAAFWRHTHATLLLGKCLAERDRLDEAEPLLRIAFARSTQGISPVNVREELNAAKEAGAGLIALNRKLGKAEVAAEWQERLAEWESWQPPPLKGKYVAWLWY